MANLHDPEWRWRVGSAQYRKQCQVIHKKREDVERDNYIPNPLDFYQTETAMVGFFYDYAKTHGFENMAVPNDVYSVVTSKLAWKFDMEITWKDVMEQMSKLRAKFFYFREFLDFPGIRLAEDKKHVHAEPAYFADLGDQEECWLYKSFRLFGFDHYKKLRYIIITKKFGGTQMECGMFDWYYIKGRHSDVGEEVIRISDYNMDAV